LLSAFCLSLFPSTVFYAGASYFPALGSVYLYMAAGCAALAASRQDAQRYFWVSASGVCCSLLLTSGLQWALLLPWIPVFYIGLVYRQKASSFFGRIAQDAAVFVLAFFVVQLCFCCASYVFYNDFFYLRQSFTFAFSDYSWLRSRIPQEPMDVVIGAILAAPDLALPAFCLGLALPLAVYLLAKKQFLTSAYIVFALSVLGYLALRLPQYLRIPAILTGPTHSVFIIPCSILFLAVILFNLPSQNRADARSWKFYLTLGFIFFLVLIFLHSNAPNIQIIQQQPVIASFMLGFIYFIIKFYIIKSNRALLYLAAIVILLCLSCITFYPFSGGIITAKRIEHIGNIFNLLQKNDFDYLWINREDDLTSFSRLALYADYRLLTSEMQKRAVQSNIPRKKIAPAIGMGFPQFHNTLSVIKYKFSMKESQSILLIIDTEYSLIKILEKANKALSIFELGCHLIQSPVRYTDNEVAYMFIPLQLHERSKPVDAAVAMLRAKGLSPYLNQTITNAPDSFDQVTLRQLQFNEYDAQKNPGATFTSGPHRLAFPQQQILALALAAQNGNRRTSISLTDQDGVLIAAFPPFALQPEQPVYIPLSPGISDYTVVFSMDGQEESPPVFLDVWMGVNETIPQKTGATN
ncbi:hypothetical protein LJB81_02185, partial [Desulfovibrio sp. OttesenSCG-928-M14]|nr:hypothetical protein [Desulfovibrio sp. OttesenSCG-928-M14]